MKRSSSGSTLIECVLALGITATIGVALVGVLPAGLDATRAGAQRSAESLIVERVRQQNEIATLSGDFYFDMNGAPLNGRNADAAFAARVEAGAGVALPGEAAPSMRGIRILISDRVSVSPFDDTRRLHEYHLLLAPPSEVAP